MIFAIRRIILNWHHYLFIVLPMAIAMAITSLFVQFAIYETSFDTWIENNEQIYAANLVFRHPSGSGNVVAETPIILVEAIEKLPEVMAVASLNYQPGANFTVNGVDITLPAAYMSPNFLNFFSLPLANDAIETLEINDSSAIITTDAAATLFGDQLEASAILNLKFGNDYSGRRIAGIIKNLPDNTHIKAQVFIAHPNLTYFAAPNSSPWDGPALRHYIKLRPGVDPTYVEEVISEQILANAPPIEIGTTSFNRAQILSVELMPITDVYLQGPESRFENRGSKELLRMLYIVVGAILIIASINFLNIIASLTFLRQREFGIRKIFGAGGVELWLLIIKEMILVALSFFVIGLLVFYIIELEFAFRLGMDVEFLSANSKNVFIIMGVTTSLILMISSSILPIFISKANPSRFLRGTSTANPKQGQRLAKFVLFIQLSLATALILGTVIIYNQVWYSTNSATGFDPENIISIKLAREDRRNGIPATIRNQILGLPFVTAASFSSSVPGNPQNRIARISRSDEQTADEVIAQTFEAEPSFLDVYSINTKLSVPWNELESRTSSNENSIQRSDDLAAAPIIVSASLAERLGLEVSPSILGQSVYFNDGFSHRIGTITAVIDNLQFGSTRDVQHPFFIELTRSSTLQLSIKVGGENLKSAMNQIADSYKEVTGKAVMNATILKDLIEAQYRTEKFQLWVLGLLSTVAIVLSSLGVFGTALLESAKNRHEVAIRKVYGANTLDIIRSICSKHVWLVGASIIVSIPTTNMVASFWLERFVARADLSIEIYLFSIAISLGLYFAIVGGKAYWDSKLRPSKVFREL